MSVDHEILRNIYFFILQYLENSYSINFLPVHEGSFHKNSNFFNLILDFLLLDLLLFDYLQLVLEILDRLLDFKHDLIYKSNSFPLCDLVRLFFEKETVLLVVYFKVSWLFFLFFLRRLENDQAYILLVETGYNVIFINIGYKWVDFYFFLKPLQFYINLFFLLVSFILLFPQF